MAIARFRLRWRFEYNDGKPARIGVWNTEALPNGDAAAWRVTKQNLARALIEYEDVSTYKTGVFAECHGHDFVNFEWIKTVSLNPLDPTGTYSGTVVGLQIRTRDEIATAYIDGHQTARALRPDEKTLSLVGCK